MVAVVADVAEVSAVSPAITLGTTTLETTTIQAKTIQASLTACSRVA